MRPPQAYELFGLALGQPASQQAKSPEISPDTNIQAAGSNAISNTPRPSPYLYAMAVCQLSFGIALISFEATGNIDAVAIIAATICLTGAVDGWIVWKERGVSQNKAFNHWNGTIITAAWYLLRFCRLS